MPDTRRTLAALQTLLADNTAGDISAQDVRDMLVSVYPVTLTSPQGRLTTESGVGVSTSDRTSQSTLYYTPFSGNGIWLYDGTIWQPYNFTERSLSLSGLTSGKNYDVFLYDNSGTLTLELSAAWTSDTTRADALTTQDGVYVKSGATTRRYLGTIRTTGTTTTVDSLAKRFVWNAYNQSMRNVRRNETAGASWTLNSTTIRQANANAANQVEVVCGLDSPIELFLCMTSASGTSNNIGHLGIGEDSTSAIAAESVSVYPSFTGASGLIAGSFARLVKLVPIGYHKYCWLECSANTGGNVTFYAGDIAGANMVVSGLSGSVSC